MPDRKPRYAFFITPHGYGHAARACAVMNSISEQQPGAFFEIFTRVPIWFFNMSIPGRFRYHDLLTDIGLVQHSSMSEDLTATIKRLDDFLPLRNQIVQQVTLELKELKCDIVLCDIAPLGIAAANASGLPSILIENFTWDWIYEGYLEEEPRLAPHIDHLKILFASATRHIRTIPVCSNMPPADLEANVTSRKPRSKREETRFRLGIDPDIPMVMVTMGGILTEFPFLRQIEQSKDNLFLIPGGSETYEKRGSLVLIPHHSDFYHPDLVEASDMVIGKLGYSTLAEAYTAGIPFGFIPRSRFRESIPMGQFARDVMQAIEINESSFLKADWLGMLPDLLVRPHDKPTGPNGADQIALDLISNF